MYHSWLILKNRQAGEPRPSFLDLHDTDLKKNESERLGNLFWANFVSLVAHIMKAKRWGYLNDGFGPPQASWVYFASLLKTDELDNWRDSGYRFWAFVMKIFKTKDLSVRLICSIHFEDKRTGNLLLCVALLDKILLRY